jgi:hypothetical protein
VQRGGSTFVLNHQALLITQHAFSVRRSGPCHRGNLSQRAGH